MERVKIGDFQAVEKMLQAGISPNPCSDAGDSLIHLLCRRGDSKMLKLFLDYGASIQVADSLGRTPLHEVVSARSTHQFAISLKKSSHFLFRLSH